MNIPQRGLDGQRRTVNYGLSTTQQVWNLRAALNVAALNCREPRYTGISSAYAAMLKRNQLTLKATNGRALAEFRERHGDDYRSAFDTYMTRVYNYFALPSAKRHFCEAANTIAAESQTIEGRAQMEAFAGPALSRLELALETFFLRYEQYQTELAAWEAQYGSGSGTYNYGAVRPLITAPVQANPVQANPVQGPVLGPVQGPMDSSDQGSTSGLR